MPWPPRAPQTPGVARRVLPPSAASVWSVPGAGGRLFPESPSSEPVEKPCFGLCWCDRASFCPRSPMVHPEGPTLQAAVAGATCPAAASEALSKSGLAAPSPWGITPAGCLRGPGVGGPGGAALLSHALPSALRAPHGPALPPWPQHARPPSWGSGKQEEAGSRPCSARPPGTRPQRPPRPVWEQRGQPWGFPRHPPHRPAAGLNQLDGEQLARR